MRRREVEEGETRRGDNHGMAIATLHWLPLPWRSEEKRRRQEEETRGEETIMAWL